MIGKSKYEQFILGGMEEIVLGWEQFYLGIGLEAYIKSKSTDRISSAFTFGEKVVIRSNFSTFNIEVYYRHFSNGSLTGKNTGQDFIGLAVGYKF